MPFTSADTEVGLILTPDRTQRSCINAASMAGLAALSRNLWVAGAVVWSGFALGKEAAQNSYFGSLLTSFSSLARRGARRPDRTPRSVGHHRRAAAVRRSAVRILVVLCVLIRDFSRKIHSTNDKVRAYSATCWHPRPLRWKQPAAFGQASARSRAGYREWLHLARAVAR